MTEHLDALGTLAPADFIALVTPEMLWRSVVWWRLHKADRLPRNDGSESG